MTPAWPRLTSRGLDGRTPAVPVRFPHLTRHCQVHVSLCLLCGVWWRSLVNGTLWRRIYQLRRPNFLWCISRMGCSTGGGSTNCRKPNCLITRCWDICTMKTSKIIFECVIQYARSRVQRSEIPPGYLRWMISSVYGSQITKVYTSNCSLKAM